MKLSDKAYKKISQIIASETIYSPREIYSNFSFLNFNFNKLLKFINIAIKTNMDLTEICTSCTTALGYNRPIKNIVRMRIAPRPFFVLEFKKKEKIIKKTIKKAIEKFM
jgi:hypothetical protein